MIRITEKSANEVFAPAMTDFKDTRPWKEQSLVCMDYRGEVVNCSEDMSKLLDESFKLGRALYGEGHAVKGVVAYTVLPSGSILVDPCHAGWWRSYNGGLFFTKFCSTYHKDSSEYFQEWVSNVINLPQYREIIERMVFVEVGGYSHGFLLDYSEQELELKKPLLMNFLCMQRAYTDMTSHLCGPVMRLTSLGLSFEEALVFYCTFQVSNRGISVNPKEIRSSGHILGHTPLTRGAIDFLLNNVNKEKRYDKTIHGVDKFLWKHSEYSERFYSVFVQLMEEKFKKPVDLYNEIPLWFTNRDEKSSKNLEFTEAIGIFKRATEIVKSEFTKEKEMSHAA